MADFSQELNRDGKLVKTPAFYDTNVAQWLMGAANAVKTAGGVWVFQRGDANGQAQIVGAAADDAAASGNPLLMAGKYNATPATRQEGDAVTLQTSATGSLRTELTGSNFEQVPGSATPSKVAYIGGKKADGTLQGLTLVAQGSNPADAEQLLGVNSIFAGEGTAWYRQANASGTTDNNSGSNVPIGALIGYNNSSFDKWRNNTESTLLVSAERTTTTGTPIQTNYNHKGVLIAFEITAASGTGGLSLRFGTPVPQSGDYPWWLCADSPAKTTTGTWFYLIYPGDTVAGGNIEQVKKIVLPRKWGINVNHADSSSYTYSLGYYMIL